jgi:hypothetical protein
MKWVFNGAGKINEHHLPSSAKQASVHQWHMTFEMPPIPNFGGAKLLRRASNENNCSFASAFVQSFDVGPMEISHYGSPETVS